MQNTIHRVRKVMANVIFVVKFTVFLFNCYFFSKGWLTFRATFIDDRHGTFDGTTSKFSLLNSSGQFSSVLTGSLLKTRTRQ